MVGSIRTIVWSAEAKKQLREAYKYIRKDSPQNAVKVCKDIVAVIRKIPFRPGHHPPDKYKLNNDDTYRVFEKHHYRVVYRVLDTKIRILRIRHTSMEPLTY